MCLAIPMQIREIDGFQATCEAKGVTRLISLFMLQDESIAVGDHVMVHLGYAIEKISPQESQSAWELFDKILDQQ